MHVRARSLAPRTVIPAGLGTSGPSRLFTTPPAAVPRGDGTVVLSLSRSVVVTGLGALCSLGGDSRTVWDELTSGSSGIKHHRFHVGDHGPGPLDLPASLVDFDFLREFDLRHGRRLTGTLDRYAALALVAADEAVQQAGLVGHEALDCRAAIVLGHAQAGFETFESCYERIFVRQSARLHPLSVPRVMLSGAASAVAMHFGVHGPVFATSSACASSAHAIVQGAALIQAGLTDVAIVGGADALATHGGMLAWLATQALSKSTCRPFSSRRDGMVIGEGAAVLVLEEAEHAKRRGGVVLGEYLGAGLTSDALHLTQPSTPGGVKAVEGALQASDIQQVEDLLVVAHGTGTVLSDTNESRVLRQVFGQSLQRRTIIATKGAHGHLMGASAALQAIVGLMAVNTGIAPPLLNYLGPDPDCDLNLVLGEARVVTARKVIVNAFGFGGLNAVLAFSGRNSS